MRANSVEIPTTEDNEGDRRGMRSWERGRKKGVFLGALVLGPGSGRKKALLHNCPLGSCRAEASSPNWVCESI